MRLRLRDIGHCVPYAERVQASPGGAFLVYQAGPGRTDGDAVD